MLSPHWEPLHSCRTMTPSGDTTLGRATLTLRETLLNSWQQERDGNQDKVCAGQGWKRPGLGAVSVCDCPRPLRTQWVPLEGDAESINRQRTFIFRWQFGCSGRTHRTWTRRQFLKLEVRAVQMTQSVLFVLFLYLRITFFIIIIFTRNNLCAFKVQPQRESTN